MISITGDAPTDSDFGGMVGKLMNFFEKIEDGRNPPAQQC